jgi:hypothetical protein
MSLWKAALLLAGLGFGASVCSQEVDNPEDIRAQRIRKIDRRLYDPSPDGMRLSGRLVTIHDRHGNLAESIGYWASGEQRSRSTYKYDADNRLVEYVTEPAHEAFKNFSRSYKLDPMGRVIEAKDHDSTGAVLGFQRFTLDDAGRVVEETLYIGDRRDSTQRKRYDSAGNMVEWTSMNGENEVVQRREYTFRKKGQQVQMLVYDSSNRLFAKTEHAYAGEQLSEVSDFSADGKLNLRWVYERNARGLVVKETIFKDGKISPVEEITYEHHP